ncbi:MAG TPA: LytR C-terminal domain-containing protein [Acidimicrobiales bacterium]|nr:LytR C-terminal domain-containing protein [Acidimicrobiales bacterium]
MAADPPTQGLPSRFSGVRAGLVMAGFLVAVGVLVAVGSRPSVSGDTLPPVTTTTVAGGHATTTTTTVPPSAVSVQVANGTTGANVAGHYTTVIGAGGWAMKPAVDATIQTITTTTVYYASGQQEAAAAIATSIGVPPAHVLPLTTAVPVAGVSGTDVVVVIGADLASAAGT